ncbi:MAG: chemotaxis protein CheW [Actinomycetia bacterium]|nr:chemotaxis protein CheW [Actinomycetes bacterium]
MRLADVRWETEAERTLFMEEAQELLDTLEQGALAEHPPLDALFRAAHTLKGSGAMLGLTAWAETAHRLEDALDAVRQGRQAWDPAVQQVVLAAVDALRAELAGAPATAEASGGTAWTLRWDAATPMVGARAYQAWQAVAAVAPGTTSDPPAGALADWSGTVTRLVVPGGADPDAVRQALEGIEGLVAVEAPEAAPPPPGPAPAAGDGGTSAGRGGTIRIGADVLEQILEGLGELLLDQGQLAYQAGDRLEPATRTVLDHMRRVALELQDITLRARMLPLDTLFRQYPRAVHDLARRLGKQIRLETVGGETELDRLVMDRLHEPLLHLLRNACDHGIEPPAARRAAGKPETGVVRIRAYAAQGHVHVVAEDDGAGIDWGRLREKAVRQGWLTSEEAARASEEQLAGLLFRPGVSTAAAVTDLSGRGVGLDVVRTFVDAIHGTVTVTSRPGAGTAFHLELPLTMAIMTALLVEAGPWTVGLPILAVERIEEAVAGVGTVLGQPAVPEGAAPVPVVSLGRWLDPAATVTDAYLVRVRDGRTRAALAVDGIRGQQEVVVKPVATLAAWAPWLAGVALLGDGRLALMADVRRIVAATAGDRERPADDGVLRAGSNQMELLVFRLSDGQQYGINVYKTREVLQPLPVTTVPGQHPWVEGFLRLRGQTVPVVSLYRALGLPEASAAGSMLITEFNQTVQAFRVDAVERMVRVRWDQVEPLPAVLDVAAGEGRRFVGLIDHPELGPIQLIDFEQILAQVAPPTYPPTPAAGMPAVAGQPVWLADDSRVARQQVERALAPLGVAVRTFADGQAVWDAVEAGEPLPRLFVLDVEMPRLDGYTLAQRLKQDPRTRELPVLLHTSLSGHWHAERAQQVQVDAIVTKFDAGLLAHTVAGLVAGVTRSGRAGAARQGGAA